MEATAGLVEIELVGYRGTDVLRDADSWGEYVRLERHRKQVELNSGRTRWVYDFDMRIIRRLPGPSF